MSGKHAPYAASSRTHTCRRMHVQQKTQAPADLGEIGPRQYLDWVCLPPIVPAALMSSCLPCVHKACLVDECVCLCVCLYACMALQSVQRAFEGLCVHAWDCAGVHRFVSLCLHIYLSLSCLPWIIVHYPPAVQILGQKRSLVGWRLAQLWVVPPLRTWHGRKSGIWVAPTHLSQDSVWPNKAGSVCCLFCPSL